MKNMNIHLLNGGYYRCTPDWNTEPFGKEGIFKLYFPVEGSARIFSDRQEYDLKAGKIYYINGFILDKYQCDAYMDVYWLHFIPESQFLSMYLSNMNPVCCWDQDGYPGIHIDFKKIPELFINASMKDIKKPEASSYSLRCYLNSMVLLLLSDIFDKQNVDISNLPHNIYVKLNPAVEYIKNNYKKSLKLDEIAQKAFLSPIYFLRLFKIAFKMTPNNYLKTIRLNEACRMLINTDMPIKQIAENSGFSNQFYFSKVFKKHFCKTPLEYRKKEFSP